jgi:hypothetical protein
MAKVERPQHVYDAELAEKGRCRIYRTDYTDACKPIYRELVIKLAEFTREKTPWWKRKKTKGKKCS